MENPENPGANRNQNDQLRVQDLHLDRIVASHPEIGPTPPDGGYGWLIVAAAIVYQITVSPLLILYGLMILKGIREEDRDENEIMRVWDLEIALVPVIMVIMKLLLESWCRSIVKVFHMPRFMALAGLCLTVAGVLLSSYTTDANSNDHILSIFAGIFVGTGYALTSQQTEVIITHYFRDYLTMAQRLVRMAPSVGNCLIPILVGYLCTLHTADSVVMIYGAILMQNCFFLASYTRPIYIEKVIRNTYNRLRVGAEDEDEVIFSNQRVNVRQVPNADTENPEPPLALQDEDGTDVVVFNSKKNAKEILDPSIQYRENKTVVNNEGRFSSDFSTMFAGNPSTVNRFSSDFGSLDITSYNRISGYQELENIDRENPQPLYRGTTVDAPQNNIIFVDEVPPGTARRTAVLKKNVITVINMLKDLNFYLYALLHLCTTFSILILGVFFPPLVWEQNSSMNTWSVSALTAVAHGSALCFILLCIVLPKSINEKSKLCAAFCLTGAIGFYGITLSGNKSFLVVWCMLASFSTAASSILQQPLYNSTLNEFDTTATMTTSNAIVASFILFWSLMYNYEYKTCFWTASLLQIVTAVAFFVASFRRRR